MIHGAKDIRSDLILQSINILEAKLLPLVQEVGASHNLLVPKPEAGFLKGKWHLGQVGS